MMYLVGHFQGRQFGKKGDGIRVFEQGSLFEGPRDSLGNTTFVGQKIKNKFQIMTLFFISESGSMICAVPVQNSA